MSSILSAPLSAVTRTEDLALVVMAPMLPIQVRASALRLRQALKIGHSIPCE
ncbi:MAG: hypothetical protein AAGA39_08075 [Pseudomonadota bacterium]